MSNTRAKFKCTEVSKRAGWGGNEFHYAAKFSVVAGNSGENESFFASTPSGNIEMTTIREDHFEVGKEYYIDFIISE